MGFSVSASAAILAVSLIMVLEVSMGTILPILTELDESYDALRKRAVDELQTAINIENITVESNASLHDVTIMVKNTGATVIESIHVHVLINGTLTSFTCDDDYWFPESHYTLSVDGISGSGDRQVKVVTNNGISSYASYST
jgi:archaellum component FlaF (FlaF/FlaG flagellin family)